MESKDREKLEAEILAEAAAMYERGVTATEFSNRIFGPTGLLRKLWSTRADRKLIAQSQLYRTLQGQLRSLETIEASQFDKDIEAAAKFASIRKLNKEPEAA